VHPDVRPADEVLSQTAPLVDGIAGTAAEVDTKSDHISTRWGCSNSLAINWDTCSVTA
jgi:hypothetical protein